MSDEDETGRGLLRLPENIFFRTAMLNFLMSKAVAPAYGAEDLQSHEWKIMGVLFSFAPLSASAIAYHVTFDKAAISRALRGLEQRGLIVRNPQRMDGRSASVEFTPQGKRVYQRILHKVIAIQQELLAPLTPAEVQALFKAYDLMEGILRERVDSG